MTFASSSTSSIFLATRGELTHQHRASQTPLQKTEPAHEIASKVLLAPLDVAAFVFSSSLAGSRFWVFLLFLACARTRCSYSSKLAYDHACPERLASLLAWAPGTAEHPRGTWPGPQIQTWPWLTVLRPHSRLEVHTALTPRMQPGDCGQWLQALNVSRKPGSLGPWPVCCLRPHSRAAC